MTILAMIAGFALGALLVNASWRRLIREKATSGRRLEMSGALYEVYVYRPEWGPKCRACPSCGCGASGELCADCERVREREEV